VPPIDQEPSCPSAFCPPLLPPDPPGPPWLLGGAPLGPLPLGGAPMELDCADELPDDALEAADEPLAPEQAVSSVVDSAAAMMIAMVLLFTIEAPSTAPKFRFLRARPMMLCEAEKSL